MNLLDVFLCSEDLVEERRGFELHEIGKGEKQRKGIEAWESFKVWLPEGGWVHKPLVKNEQYEGRFRFQQTICTDVSPLFSRWESEVASPSNSSRKIGPRVASSSAVSMQINNRFGITRASAGVSCDHQYGIGIAIATRFSLPSPGLMSDRATIPRPVSANCATPILAIALVSFGET